ncbi:MAG: hypothetical protein JNL32_00125 [Candidatus Kapabacteria bacterium]|nr:hypothetical protein [Candidatus Kapabacteria bacterium]
MKTPYKREISITVDKLTNSIENAQGESFDTVCTRMTPADVAKLNSADWSFDWSDEIQQQQTEVYKLTVVGNPSVIQGLISIMDMGDHIFVNLINSAKHNQGRKRMYRGVAGNMFAFACKTAFERGYQGYVAFLSKSGLVQHYIQSLGAEQVGRSLRLHIDETRARKLVERYFKSFWRFE